MRLPFRQSLDHAAGAEYHAGHLESYHHEEGPVDGKDLTQDLDLNWNDYGLGGMMQLLEGGMRWIR
ncbi:MAG: hypothetical protein R2828_15435 [Saprospiraceae bacterium]